MTRTLATVITRNNICEVACKAYSKAISPENLRMAFQKTGIFPLDKSAINTDYLLPSTVFNNCEQEQEQNIADEDRRDDNDSQQVGQGYNEEVDRSESQYPT